jgi:flagellar motility protein MotE (MotC chaperone)
MSMRTMQAMTARALVLGVAILGGWWASRAAATGTETRPRRVAIASADDDGFHKLLEDVQRRTVELDQREREVTERSAALESLEEAVAESLTSLQAKDGDAPASGACRLRGGVGRIYDSMRPEEAAQILDQLDDETLRVVFARMETKQVAAIMAAMSRERAVAFTKTLATDPDAAPATKPAAR